MTAATAADHFSQTYAQARQRFLDAAAAAGLDVASHTHPLKGHEGEDLALDVARDGPADAEAVLIISSACHGVEGYCGSGVQVALLHNPSYDFNDELIPLGATAWVHMAEEWLAQPQG